MVHPIVNIQIYGRAAFLLCVISLHLCSSIEQNAYICTKDSNSLNIKAHMQAWVLFKSAFYLLCPAWVHFKGLSGGLILGNFVPINSEF